MLHATFYKLQAAWYMLHATCYMLNTACYMLQATCYIIHATYCMLHTTCYIHFACFTLFGEKKFFLVNETPSALRDKSSKTMFLSWLYFVWPDTIQSWFWSPQWHILHPLLPVQIKIGLQQLDAPEVGYPGMYFFSRPLPKAGRELQTELNTIMEGGIRTLSEKPAGGKC